MPSDGVAFEETRLGAESKGIVWNSDQAERRGSAWDIDVRVKK
jgi:hypothetical protein